MRLQRVVTLPWMQQHQALIDVEGKDAAIFALNTGLEA